MRKTAKTLGQLFKQIRIDAGATQSELAKMLGYKTSQYISNYERGLCNPAPEVTMMFMDVFDVPKRQIKSMMLKQYAEKLDQMLI